MKPILCALSLVCAASALVAQDSKQPAVAIPAVREPRVEPVRDAARVALFVAGDGSVKNHGAGEGWGDYLGLFFDERRLQVLNWATEGGSGRFFEKERWTRLRAQVRPGDFVLVQFGGGDEALPEALADARHGGVTVVQVSDIVPQMPEPVARNNGYATARDAQVAAMAVVDGIRSSPQLKLATYLKPTAAVLALDREPVAWARGIEGQRKADLGNGYFLNPIVSGDHPDPSILKDNDDYYMTFSSFDAYPGLVIWHSRDLINWTPIGPALFKNVGSVWAPELIKHAGRYYIYFPGIAPYRSNYVIWADSIRGPWSEPIDLQNRRIDPGHAVGPDGKRYLFLSAGYRVELAPDGLSIVGDEKKVYDGWPYPKEWVVETFAQEGPKILKHGDYYYQVLAQGGTAGPPTGHMIVAARARSIDGPWEHSPYNPILRTQSAEERWWSKGHGTLVEGPDRRWWMVYHAYENGFYNLGRQTVLEPIEWLDDGWFRAAGYDPARPIPKPVPASTGDHGAAFSDDFSINKMGVQWSFYAGDASDRERYRYEHKRLVLKAKGTSPADSSPLWFVTGDHAYEIEVSIDADAGASAGLLVFYNRRLYGGLGFSAKNFLLHTYGIDRQAAKPSHIGQALHLRLRNDRHIVSLYYSVDGRRWEQYDRRLEVSGYHHNVGYDFLSLRPALYAAGSGEVRFSNFRYQALP